MIKAIETVYNNYRFRSRLEARWALFMDTLGVEYRYEPEGFDLDVIWYLPDFYLPQQKCWLEIKPDTPSREERAKAIDLCIGTYEEVAIFAGDVWDNVVGYSFYSFSPKTREEFLLKYKDYPYPLHWLSTTECVSHIALAKGIEIWGADVDRGYGWGEAHWGECLECHAIGVFGVGIDPHPTKECPWAQARRSQLRTPRIMEAFTAARQARFGKGGRG